MKTKLFFTMLSIAGILISGCVKDELYIDNTPPSSDVPLVINEVMSNMGDPNPDWIEIYNTSDAEIDISGFGVYDKPDAIFKFAAGTKIGPHGYYVIVCDKTLATSEPDKYANFGISSGGETVYLVDTTSAIVDEADVPAMALGISYARIPDGGDVWQNSNPTKGTANSNTNEPPVIEADTIVTGMVNDNQRFEYNIVVKDASGVADVKLWMQTPSETLYLTMVPMGEGKYQLLLPLLTKGSIISYYIEATDETGLKTRFKPATANAFVFTVVDGLAIFNSVTISNSNPVALEPVNFTVSVSDNGGVAGVRLYYLVNDTTTANKLSIDLVFAAGVWTGTIPGQDDGATIRYYIRATDNAGVKSYYPSELPDGYGNTNDDFNHDKGSTWPQITVAPLVILNQLVINEIQASGTPWDFIELHNSTSAAIDISGFKIYDSGGPAAAYAIPAGTTVAAGGFYVIETGSGSPQGQFGISSSGEDITLVNTSSEIVDQLLKVNWPGVPLVARKKDGAAKWIVPSAESKGTTNP